MQGNEILKEGLASFGIQVSSYQLEQFEIYRQTLLEYNQRMNLTAIENEREMDIKHFLDSASCLLSGKLKQDVSIIDVGTGAGFPSVPLKILRPDIELTLMDSLNKRIHFLRQLGERLQLNEVCYIHSRAEDAGQNKLYRERYDVAVARAVASLPVLLEYCLPFVKVGGYFLCQKGPAVMEEIEQAQKALSVLGAEIEKLMDIDLPFSDLQHKILIVRKTKPTLKAYPRKAGKPSKEPIL